MPPRRRLTALRPEEPLFPDEAPPARPRFVQAWAAQCAVCDSATTAVATGPALCAWCAANPCAALDILEELDVGLEERLAQIWAPLEKVIRRATDKEELAYANLCNLRIAAEGNPEKAAELAERVRLARSSERTDPALPSPRERFPGLAKILDMEAGLLPSIEAKHREIEAERQRIREARSALLSNRHATKNWRVPDALAQRRNKIPRFTRPHLLEFVPDDALAPLGRAA